MSVRPALFRGDIVLSLFPFTDLSGAKLRPAVVVGRPDTDDLVLAFVTSQISFVDPRTSYVLVRSDPEFASTGLKWPSLVRLNKLATVHRPLVRRRLGRIGPRTDAIIAERLRYVFELDV